MLMCIFNVKSKRAFTQLDLPISSMSHWCDLFNSILNTTSFNFHCSHVYSQFLDCALLPAGKQNKQKKAQSNATQNKSHTTKNLTSSWLLTSRTTLRKRFLLLLGEHIFNVTFFMKITFPMNRCWQQKLSFSVHKAHKRSFKCACFWLSLILIWFITIFDICDLCIITALFRICVSHLSLSRNSILSRM